MLKFKIFKKLSIIISCILVIMIIRIYPKFDTKTNYPIESYKGVVYLLDTNNYLSRLDIVFKSKDNIDIIPEMIDILTIDNKNVKIRDGFYSLIPEHTKLKNYNIEDKNVTLNFSKELLNISKKNEEKLTESLIYSLTSLKGIDSITIKVDDLILNETPHNKIKLPTKLDKSFKINKEYNLLSKDDINITTIYYPAIYNDYKYFIPVTKIDNNKKEKIEIIISELKSSTTYNSNLVSYLNQNTELINHQIVDKSLILNFNDQILSDIETKNIDESITYAINLSIEENYNDIESVMYYVDDTISNSYFLLLG